MYLLDEKKNSLTKIPNNTFSSLKYSERNHLQEWIANTPEVLGEELLIIQKEFDGFDDTLERLDLLALDKDGKLVVIENKLDDSGRDVTWQILKYVSYCSTLSVEQIIEIYQSYLDALNIEEDAADNITEFLEITEEELSLTFSEKQRMILVSGSYRKEVTSTAMWLLNQGIDIKCIKVSPHRWEDKTFIDVEQIIPVKDVEDYIIKKRDKDISDEKRRDDSRGIRPVRKRFWTEFLKDFSEISDLFANVNPVGDSWVGTGSGVSGASFNFAITQKNAVVDLSIALGEKEYNEEIFDGLLALKEDIESDFGEELTWERLDHRKSCRICKRLNGVNINNPEDWEQIKHFLIISMPKLETALKQRLKEVKEILDLKLKPIDS